MINQQLDGVFIHVSNMSQSIDWYSRLLNLPEQDVSHEGMIYDLPLGGTTQVILDAFPKAVSPRGTGPRIMLQSTDLLAAREIAETLSDNVTDIQDIGSSIVFYMDDPDGNLICIRQSKSVQDE